MSEKLTSETELLTILDQIDGWVEWHCDPNADIDDPSPDDMHAHTNGLIMQASARARRILENSEMVRKESEIWNSAIEAALLSLPGGQVCDPQNVADTLRELIKPNAQAHPETPETVPHKQEKPTDGN